MELKPSIRIILIRHGMTEFNLQKKYMGYTDEPVIKDKLLEYKRLQEILQEESITRIYSSDLIRCQQTARYLFANLELKLDQRLREINFGDWEGKTYEELKHIPAYCQWLSNWQTECIPNGECGESFRTRVIQFLEDYILKTKFLDESIAIVSHGGVIRHIVSYFCEDMEYWDVEVSFGNAIILDLNRVGGKWTCISSSVVPTVEKENL